MLLFCFKKSQIFLINKPETEVKPERETEIKSKEIITDDKEKIEEPKKEEDKKLDEEIKDTTKESDKNGLEEIKKENEIFLKQI